MLLILSNTRDATADYLAGVLTRHGLDHVRLDTDAVLGGAQVHFDLEGGARLRLAGRWLTPSAVSTIWYRRPERLRLPSGVPAATARDAAESPEERLLLDEWSEALEGFLRHVPAWRWMNHPSSNVAASHKLEQLTTAGRYGLRVPRSLVTQDPSALRAFFRRCGGRVIVKPLATGYVDRHAQSGDAGAHGSHARAPEPVDSLIYTNELAEEHLRDLLDLHACPTLFQERVDKLSDVRIIIVDGDVHAVEMFAPDEDGKQRCDVRRDNMEHVVYREVSLPDQVELGLRRMTARYRLRFAAVDMAITPDGGWTFFEINPNGQWAWLDLAGATSVAGSFVRAFRAGRRKPPAPADGRPAGNGRR